MEIIDVFAKVGFSEQFFPRILKAAGDYKVPLICLLAGQAIPPHQSGLGVFYFMTGKGIMTVEGKEVEVKPGTMVIAEKGETRGIRATEKLTAFAVHMGK